jgi:glycine cleavage system protein P-like pyridoxal-binding family
MGVNGTGRISHGLRFGPRSEQGAVLSGVDALLRCLGFCDADRCHFRHECVFSDARQKSYNVTTLDIAKRLMEYGSHPPTVYFPLVVQGAMMTEPTETESKESIDAFIAAMRAIAREAEENPELLQQAPRLTKVRRLDETTAARKPRLKG